MSEQEEAKPQEDKANDYSQEWLIAVAVGLVMLLVIGIYFSKAGLPNVSDADLRGELGTLGDFFGGVLNPILSFVSIVLLLFTIKQTRQSLDLSTKNLVQTETQLGYEQDHRKQARIDDVLSTLSTKIESALLVMDEMNAWVEIEESIDRLMLYKWSEDAVYDFERNNRAFMSVYNPFVLACKFIKNEEKIAKASLYRDLIFCMFQDKQICMMLRLSLLKLLYTSKIESEYEADSDGFFLEFVREKIKEEYSYLRLSIFHNLKISFSDARCSMENKIKKCESHIENCKNKGHGSTLNIKILDVNTIIAVDEKGLVVEDTALRMAKARLDIYQENRKSVGIIVEVIDNPFLILL